MKKIARIFLAGLIIFAIGLTSNEEVAFAASSPYDVPSSVRNGWDDRPGGKTFNMTTGRKLVYDVYSNKYINGGFQVVNRNFSQGHGNQPYLNFRGWAVLFGHKRHTSSNHDTYIVAQKTGSSETKIYSTIPINLSATKELEYNSQGPTGLYNECSSNATNKDNIECNMQYNNVGFDAYIPLNELFQNNRDNVSWRLYIVKKVDSQIVYSQLILPFEFSDRSFNTGKIDLTSGINASNLIMNDYPVIRRTQAKQTGVSGHDLGYFQENRTYKRIDANETGTSVWYGVQSPHDNNNKRWANTAYWTFGGDQAVIKFTPEDTNPEHKEHAITNHRYKNGNDYWAQPNDKVNIRLRGFDNDSLLERTSMTLSGSATARVRHSYNNGNNNFDYYTQTSSIDAFSGQRTYESSTQKTREATFQVAGKTHAHSYDISAWHQNNVGNNTGWVTTNLKLRIDGVAPTHTSNSVLNARYVNGSDYWVQPNDTLSVRLRQNDPHSGNRLQYLRLYGNGQDVRSLHTFHGSTTYNEKTWTGDHVSIDSALREENTAHGRVLWDVTPKTHGHSYDVRYYFEDNARNTSGAYTSTGKNIRVDGVAPLLVSETITNHRYKNGNDYWIRPNDTVQVSIRGRDLDSGLKDTRLSTGNGSDRNISVHSWNGTATNISHTHNSDNFTVSSPNRTYSSGNIREVTFDVKGNTNRASHEIRHRFADNVDNISAGDTHGWSVAQKYLKVDGDAPTATFTNTQNTTIRINTSDIGSGVKSLRYRTSNNNGQNYTSWTSWVNQTNTDIVLSNHGEHRIQVEIQDNVGNIGSSTSNMFKFNNPPKADFVWSPANVYNNTTVLFDNRSTDPEGDILTNQWSYQEPNSTTWVNFSTVKDPSRIFNIKGTWKVRLTVNDGEFSDSVTKNLIVQNRAPVANFTYSPTTIYNNTNITFTNSSTDADSDTLSYQWAYQEPQSNSWVDFSTSTNPTRILNKQGEWKVRVTASDGTASHAATKTITVRNRNPIGGFNFDKPDYLTTDAIKITSTASDPDGDNLTHLYEVTSPNNQKTTYNTANPTITDLIRGTYTVKQTVTDPFGGGVTVTKNVVVNEINLKATSIEIVDEANKPVSHLVVGRNYKAKVVYSNTGNLDISKHKIGLYEGNTRLTDLTANAITKASSSTVYLSFTARNPGQKVFKAFIDYPNEILESIETDNEAQVSMFVNTEPVGGINPDKEEYWIEDNICLRSTAFDPDNHRITIHYKIILPSGKVIESNNPNYCWKVEEHGNIIVEQTVTDEYGEEDTVQIIIVVKNLFIKGKVDHTDDWLKIHEGHGHPPHYFYSGETIILTGNTPDAPSKYVKATLITEDVNGIEIEETVMLNSQSLELHINDFFKEHYMNPESAMKKGPLMVNFEVEFYNGAVRNDVVWIEIIGSTYDAFDLHQSF
ncbi:hypothetical protein K7887_22460 (plasmid) [Sutcliffiella horikoshii]|uniref:PKD domain-containing protein n=1 Tax=Sutcliffiella horikoshii TaxID=79883 RepID=UPI001CBCDF53|nr:PKD domain-containing protein [Sutcliffiella horikoshii]UAL49883.1 hypothetical protein K7887_22460 [Sutcliffiella horikoshii]